MPVGAVWFAYHPHGMWARLGRVLVDDGPMGRSIAVILLAAAWVATWRPQVDPDAWWHVSIGKAVLAGGIPATDPFSWLTAGDRFVAHSWLWDVLMAMAYGAGGATGTSLLVVPVTAGIVVAAWALIGIAAPGIAPIPRSVLVVLGVVASLPLWAPRGQTLDVLFVLATAFAIASYLRLGTRTALFALPVIGVSVGEPPWQRAPRPGGDPGRRPALAADRGALGSLAETAGRSARGRGRGLARGCDGQSIRPRAAPLSVRSRGSQRVLVRHHRMALTGLPFPGAAGCPSADREPSPARRRLAAAPA